MALSKNLSGFMVYTDEVLAYTGLEDFRHEAVNHSVKEFVKGPAHTNGLESLGSLLKIGYRHLSHR